MYKLYWNPGSAAMAPHAVLQEIGARYELIELNLERGQQREPAYLKLNPNARVPTLVIDDAQVIYESAAICMYLADRHPEAGLAPAIGDPARGAYLQWLTYMSNTLQTACLRYYYPTRCITNPDHAPEVASKALEDTAIIWDRIDQAIGAADEATAAATEAGWLQPGERADRCLRRWQAAAAAARTLAEEEDGKATDAEAAFDTADGALQTLEEDLGALRRDAERDRTRLERFDTDLARLATDNTVTALLGGAPTDVADIERAQGVAARAATDSAVASVISVLPSAP